jgi:alkylhydroperoxidase family enzyme
VASLRAAGATDAELAEIVGAVALNIFSNYFNHIAGTEVDFPEVEASGNKPACACG